MILTPRWGQPLKVSILFPGIRKVRGVDVEAPVLAHCTAVVKASNVCRYEGRNCENLRNVMPKHPCIAG